MLFLTTLGMSNWVYAQQDAQYTQYMYNPMNINPAYAGSRDVLSIFGMHRTQWVGLEGAPTTNVFSIHTPLKNERNFILKDNSPLMFQLTSVFLSAKLLKTILLLPLKLVSVISN